MTCKSISYLLLVFLLLCGGCGLTEGVVQKEAKSFLWFTGNTQNAIVYIDNLAPITLDNTNKSSSIHYELSPGKHSIIVKKSGEEVVDRNILLGNGITKEIQIP